MDMAIRKRAWETAKGTRGFAWVVDYSDQNGKRHIESYPTKQEAKDRETVIRNEVRERRFTNRRQSVSVAVAAERWLENCAAKRLQITTRTNYQRHVERYIVPHLGRLKLADLTTDSIDDFKAALQREGRSDDLMRKVLVSLGSVMKHALRRRLIAQNVMAGFDKELPQRRSKLVVGTDIPEPCEIAALLAKYHGSYRPLLVVAIFGGLRSSELRGLRWADVDLKRGELHVRQRADRHGTIDRPKSRAGERVVPLPPIAINTLKEFKLRAKPGYELVFPSRSGKPMDHANIVTYGLVPAMKEAGVVKPDGKAKYTGLHALRHWFASWCINRKADGGLELPLKNVSDRLGHATVAMTSDTYGHLFRSGDAYSELAQAEKRLLALA
jgi:integrase